MASRLLVKEGNLASLIRDLMEEKWLALMQGQMVGGKAMDVNEASLSA